MTTANAACTIRRDAERQARRTASASLGLASVRRARAKIWEVSLWNPIATAADGLVRGRPGRKSAPQMQTQLTQEHLPAVPLRGGAQLPQIGQPHPGARQHRKPLLQGLLDTARVLAILVGRRRPQHRNQVGIGAARDGIAAHDAAVQVAAMQPRPELVQQQTGGEARQAVVGGLDLRQIGLGEDIALRIEAVTHLLC
jgi:hypothetical protein